MIVILRVPSGEVHVRRDLIQLVRIVVATKDQDRVERVTRKSPDYQESDRLRLDEEVEEVEEDGIVRGGGSGHETPVQIRVP